LLTDFLPEFPTRVIESIIFHGFDLVSQKCDHFVLKPSYGTSVMEWGFIDEPPGELDLMRLLRGVPAMVSTAETFTLFSTFDCIFRRWLPGDAVFHSASGTHAQRKLSTARVRCVVVLSPTHAPGFDYNAAH
jgi:hypothetical protein